MRLQVLRRRSFSRSLLAAAVTLAWDTLSLIGSGIMLAAQHLAEQCTGITRRVMHATPELVWSAGQTLQKLRGELSAAADSAAQAQPTALNGMLCNGSQRLIGMQTQEHVAGRAGPKGRPPSQLHRPLAPHGSHDAAAVPYALGRCPLTHAQLV